MPASLRREPYLARLTALLFVFSTFIWEVNQAIRLNTINLYSLKRIMIQLHFNVIA